MKFKLDILSHIYRRRLRYSRWKYEYIDANNPFDALDIFHKDHPAENVALISEIAPNDLIVKSYNMQNLKEHREEILIEYDLKKGFYNEINKEGKYGKENV